MLNLVRALKTTDLPGKETEYTHFLILLSLKAGGVHLYYFGQLWQILF